MVRTALGIPPDLAKRSNRVIRPRDAQGVYEHPRAEFARLTDRGVLRRLATGYYALVPQDRLGDQRWTPGIEAAALGMAQADYGTADVALMGVSAARHHSAIPRALAVAVVAVPKQRPQMETEVGRIVFVKRDVSRLDLERVDVPLTSGWVTTIEQTLLDLSARPTLGNVERRDVDVAVKALATKADWTLVARLAKEQHKPAALGRAMHTAGRTDA
jgi:predicted transcriptional regulator of viral defense system